MIRGLIEKVIKSQDLTQAEAQQAMELIMRGEATAAQIATYITALRMKGETVDEITGSAMAMRAAAASIQVQGSLVDVHHDDGGQPLETIIDTCGTGGDCANTFNISTAAALVIAGLGLTVAKHGNRSVSSKSGSADVLEACGVHIALNPEQVAACINNVGIGFLFAPTFHPAMKYAVGPRREIGVRTIFNILGPLCNPAHANVQLLGVYDEALVETMANVLRRLGVYRAMVVHGEGGLDELSLLGKSVIGRISSDRAGVELINITPNEVGLQPCQLTDLQGGTAEDNAKILLSVLSGARSHYADAVLLNAGAVCWIAGRTQSIKEGVELARSGIANGQAKNKLDELIAFTRQA